MNISFFGLLRLSGLSLIFISVTLLLGCPGFGDEGAESSFSELPLEPTWADVSPVFDTYCIECHGPAPQQGAPAGIRYDTCEDTDSASGAQTFAQRAKVRMVDQVPSPMPPSTFGATPTDEEVEIVRRWVDTGAPCGGE